MLDDARSPATTRPPGQIKPLLNQFLFQIRRRTRGSLGMKVQVEMEASSIKAPVLGIEIQREIGILEGLAHFERGHHLPPSFHALAVTITNLLIGSLFRLLHLCLDGLSPLVSQGQGIRHDYSAHLEVFFKMIRGKELL